MSQLLISPDAIPPAADAENTGSDSVNEVKYLPSMSTLNVSPPLFLVKVTIPLLVLKVAPVTNSLVSVNELIYPATE